MSCVRPKVMPQMYAKISLQITKDTGKKNQIMPSKTLFMMKCAWTTIKYNAMCVHANCVNWNR
jgi:hypothetical protein